MDPQVAGNEGKPLLVVLLCMNWRKVCEFWCCMDVINDCSP